MDEFEIEKLSYAMQEAYINNRNRENAVIDVLNNLTTIERTKESVLILKCMWSAIDAYVDINEG